MFTGNMRPAFRVSVLVLSLVVFAPFASAATRPAICVSGHLQSIVKSNEPDYKKSGYFVKVSDQKHKQLAERFKKNGVTKELEGDIRRVGQKDLAVDLNAQTPEQARQLLAEGRQKISELYYLTSGAGLWSRGGGQVKALIPFNIKDLLDPKDFEKLLHSGAIASASSPEEVLKLVYGSERFVPGVPVEEHTAELIAKHKNILEQLITKARQNPRSMNPIDIKLSNVALNSERAQTYIPFDIWTSEQTHEPIRAYLAQFKAGFKDKIFHEDPAINAKIKTAIGKYLQESEKRGETHLFGFQEGYHALEQATGAPVTSTPLIGEGAGMAKAYLDESGRAAALGKMGKKTWVFENIEVVTDLPIAMGAHSKAGKPVSVILVPQKPGYSGGSPFLVPKGNGHNLELHEMSALPKSFAEGNEYFNSNTIFQSLALPPPSNVGFEVKTFNGKKVVRVKMNAGDVTLDAPTAGIGGRIGVEYENFKNYKEFGENGSKLIDTFRGIWARDVGELN